MPRADHTAQIHQCIRDFHERGVTPTVRAVHAQVGGSFKTISRALAAFRGEGEGNPPVSPLPSPPVAIAATGVPGEVIAELRDAVRAVIAESRDAVRRDIEASHQYSMAKVEAAYERLMEMGEVIRGMSRSPRSAASGAGESVRDPEKDELVIALARANALIRRLTEENGRLIAMRDKPR